MDLGQVALHAEDLQRASVFYEQLTGTPPTGLFDPPGLLFFDLGGVRLLLDKAAPPSLIYLKAHGIVATIERLRAAGVEIVAEPHVIFTHTDAALGPAGTAEWQAFFRDPEDNLVGLIEHQDAK